MIKLLLLKSGEDIIAEIYEMTFGEGDQKRVVGYYLTKPCVVKINTKRESENKKMEYNVSMYPWMPLSAEETIPVVADWVVTMVTPEEKLFKMYKSYLENNWQFYCREILRKAINEQCVQSQIYKATLLATQNRPILYIDEYNSVLGIKGDKQGLNLVGKALEHVRRAIKIDQNSFSLQQDSIVSSIL